VRIFECGDPQEAAFGPVSVWGASWSATGLDLSFFRRFHVPDDGRLHLLLLHGTLRSVPAFLMGQGADAYAPFDPADVERCGFALCLAGHLHAGFRVRCVVYPGSPEPLGWPRVMAVRRPSTAAAQHGPSGAPPSTVHGLACVETIGTTVGVHLVAMNSRPAENESVGPHVQVSGRGAGRPARASTGSSARRNAQMTRGVTS
jgi:hypothetical protein